MPRTARTNSYSSCRPASIAPPPYSAGSRYGDSTPLLRNEETTPLLAAKTRISYPYRRYATILIVSVLLIGASVLHLVSDLNNTDSPAVRDRIRKEWQQEIERKNAALADLTKNHERELEAADRAHQAKWDASDSALRMREGAIKDKEDAMRRDEEHRKRSALLWIDLKPDQRCLSLESRRYTAELVNVPVDPDVDGLKWCMETQIEIHGNTYERPRRCVRDDGGKIIAEWITHSNEPTCKTFWAHHTKKECYGNHKRIFEAKLENHQPPWDNWQEMCFSTPSHFNFGHHDHPDTCRETAHEGIFGSWFVFDAECP